MEINSSAARFPTGASAQPSPGLAVASSRADMQLQSPRDSEGEGNKRYAEEIRILAARSAREVENLRDVWTSWQWEPNSDIDFYLQVLSARPEILRPHVLVLYRDGSPVAMLVGRLVQGQVESRLGYARLFRTAARTLTFIQGGRAGDLSRENSRLLIADVMRSLRTGEADLATFRYARTDSPFYDVVAKFPGTFARDRFPQIQPHWKLELPTKAEELYCKFSSKGRKNLRWQAKKLEEVSGGVKITCFRMPRDLDRMFHDVEAVARKTYHRGLGVGFVDSAEMRERMQLQAEKGWLRAYVLNLGDVPAAFWIGTMCGRKFFSDFLGYDDRWGKFSPGTFLMTKILEQFCAEGVEEVDFGLGDAPYKQRFGNCWWEEASIDIFAPTLKGLRINALRTPAIFTEQVVKKTLEKTQILPRIKRLWRNRAMKVVQHDSTDSVQ